MKISIDREYSILNACSNDVASHKMPYYTYLMQVAGFDLHYKYTIHSNRIRSHGLRGSIDSLIADGAITSKYKPTIIGSDIMLSYLLTQSDINKATLVAEYVKSVSVDILYFTCVVDMVIEEKLSTGNYIKLMTDKEQIFDTISYLCGEFDFKVFDACVGALRRLKSK